MDSARKAINQRVLRDLKKRSTFGISFYFVLAFILLAADDFYLQHQLFALVFFSAVTAICVVRLIHVMVFEKLAAWNKSLNKKLFILTILFSTVIWGSGFAAMMMLEGILYNKTLMTVCSAAICAGGVVAYFPSRLLAIFYNALTILPAGLVLLIEGVNLSLAAMILLYFLFMLILTFRGNSEYWVALENEIKLQEMSRRDALTGLYNRRYFNEVYDSEWKRASREQIPCTLILGDIDHFKRVNDTNGHLAGDLFLKKFAEIMSSVFQRETDLVARYGGEEFVVLLPDTNTLLAFDLAEKVRARVAATVVEYKNKSISTTVSFGIASEVPDYKRSSVKLIGKVDDALYRAKEEGRNRIVIAKENQEVIS